MSVTLEWTTLCHLCGHEHVEKQHALKDVTNAPPPGPIRCDGCKERLRRQWHTWQEFEVVRIDADDDEPTNP